MVEAIPYRAFQSPSSFPPPIPAKKPRLASMLMMNNPRYVPPQTQHPAPAQLTHYTTYEQYGSDRLHPNHVHRRQASGSSIASCSTYQLQRDLPTININFTPHDLAQRQGSINSTGSHVPPSQYRIYSPEPYVATLRKQRATVWCDRAQTEDPSQRKAKNRRTIEVTGSSYTQDINNHGFGGSSSNSPASSLYGGASGHGRSASMKPSTVKKKTWMKSSGGSGHSSKLIEMDPGSLIVGAVPTRLSASEATVDSSDEENYDGEAGTRWSRRVPRGSFNSSHRHSPRESERSRRSADGLRHMNSTGSKSSAGSSAYSAPIAEEEEEQEPIPASNTTLKNNSIQFSPQYFPRDMGTRRQQQSDDYFMNAPHPSRRGTSGSGSTSSSGSMVEGLGPLPSGLTIDKVRAPASVLRRRGSVDEREARTRTMSGIRLYVANPDS